MIKLGKDDLLIGGSFLAGLGAVWLLTRNRHRKVTIPATHVPVVDPVPGVAWPKAGNILSFGYKRSETHTHQGVDFPAPRGTPVYAAQAGRVTHAVTEVQRGFSGYGKVVVISCPATSIAPELWYLYAHLDKVQVTVGQFVQVGQQIGTVGRTCYKVEDPMHLCGGNHLHFEISPRAYPQDSEAWRYDPQQVLIALNTGEKPADWAPT